MLFNSFEFLIFLPIVFVLYWMFYKNTKAQNIILLTASYVFYGWWDWRFLSLILFSTIVDYIVGRNLMVCKNQKQRKLFLWISILINIGLLGFFKYYNFFTESLIEGLYLIGITIQTGTLRIILPVGISFYTFQTMSYTIDVYKKKLHPTKNFIAFATFVSFFPQLVAGPIERAPNLLPQFLKFRKFSYAAMSAGTKQIILGFFLKLVIADRAGIYVDTVFNNASQHEGFTFLFATFLFAFQIYGDFAGYSLIAIGTAKLFGVSLITNFQRPYMATSVGDFWKRWHISLSSWFRDYVYIPLGGSRTKMSKWVRNILITFLVSGLWHGANWTFILWGTLNGIYILFESILFKEVRKTIFSRLITFVLICFSWVLFRANSIGEAIQIIGTIFSNPGTLFIPNGADIVTPVYALLAISMLFLYELWNEFFAEKYKPYFFQKRYAKLSFYCLIIILILYMGVFNNSQFIYFQF
ncbi:MAG: MBOAT family protein [Bacteroidia bacterium]|nr:MBOAT family protein [Bacteroidia bacterium]